ncbi:MAG: MSMEG_0568 family radical SAM protein [Desulfarculaceae bacterium]|nr:MSMEG_0568 family radical SAM protein [Desulfarculaceae bacterium]MCF8072687.1 MSMEG_0568 family radical SAM protein [Desulfarculaceae bacterium]MCF8102566.1 MSMEG_0568 family radical SAM protein [Desulfarculaceae bacterium]MCF8116475.1 MSMEG_0568 family radical SAM protein [Desulfarculaceae bacterium]
MQTAEIITQLQSLGLRVEAEAEKRAGGAGPAEGGALLINGVAATVPTDSPFAADSPWVLRSGPEGAALYLDGEKIPAQVELLPTPRFYAQRTPEGVPLKQVALMHGQGCLASTVLQRCLFWDSPNRCSFCGIELSLANEGTLEVKTPEQLALAAARAKELDGASHVVLTTGCAAPAGSELKHLAACAQAIKESSGLPIHAQFLPPPFNRSFRRLAEAGVDTVGIHVESFDLNVLESHAVPKYGLGLERFFEAWMEAVEVFGPGQVSSFVIAGLGEDPEGLITGCRMLAELGVYPFLLPLRPIPGSELAQAAPPDPAYMAGLYQEVAAILQQTGLSAARSKAGCVRCGACSALGSWELPEARLVVRPARDQAEREAGLAVRQGVFVQEQHIVQLSDHDEYDDYSIHLLALDRGRVVGTVRVYQRQDQPNAWVGGRLAVARDQRRGGAGAALVREAMRTVRRRGCTRFTAEIQEANVAFFQRLGWSKAGETYEMHGWTHQPMEADLDAAPDLKPGESHAA